MGWDGEVRGRGRGRGNGIPGEYSLEIERRVKGWMNGNWELGTGKGPGGREMDWVG